MTMPRAKAWMMTALTMAFLGLLIRDVARETPSCGMRRTEPIRRNLHRLKAILFTVERQLDALHEVNESEQITLMRSAAGLLRDYLLPHLAAEEEVLHAAIDRLMPEARVSPTQASTCEHDLMRRWIQELEALADAPFPDHNAFARRGERLLGLIEAHFEVDEAVLFPLLDEVPPVLAGQGSHRP